MGLLFRDRLENRTGYGYTSIDNRVLSDNYTDLSVDAYMILTRCLSYASGWQLNWTQFENKYKITTKRRLKALEELAAKGHYIQDKWKEGKQWEYNYIFFEIAQPEDVLEQFRQNFLPKLRKYDYGSKIMDVKFNMHNYTCINRTDNNNNNINNKNNNNNEFNNKNRTCSEQGSLSNFENNIIYDTHEPTDSDSFRFNNDENKENIGGDFTNLNISPKPVRPPKHHKQFKGQRADGTQTKNKAEYLAEQEAQPLDNVLPKSAKMMGAMSDDEVSANRAQKAANEAKAAQQRTEQLIGYKQGMQNRREKYRIEINQLIDQDYTDKDIIMLFKAYIETLTAKGITITVAQYNVMKAKLEDYSTSLAGMKEILNVAISYGTPMIRQSFNSIDFKQNKSNNTVTAPIKHEPKVLPKEAFMPALDENGNPYLF